MRKILKGQDGLGLGFDLGELLSNNQDLINNTLTGSINDKLAKRSKMDSFIKSLGNIGGITGPDFSPALNFTNGAMQALSPKRDNSSYGAEQAIAGTISKMPGWIGLIGKGMQLNSNLSNRFGTSINTMSKEQANASGVSGVERVVNNALGAVTNMLGGPLLGALNKSRPNVKFDGPSLVTSSLSGAWGGAVNDMNIAAGIGDNLILGRGKTNKLKQGAIDNNVQITGLGLDNNKRISSVPTSSQSYDAQNFNRNSGGQQYSALGKHGMKLLSKEELGKILSSHQEITKFQNGGSIMIPEGALHAHKHHMEDVNPELAEDLTKKGIPVVVTDSEGNVEQCAEIEKEEIIFEKSLTQQIEELWKKGDEESMIEAGKLIVDALFNDCTDNTGLIANTE